MQEPMGSRGLAVPIDGAAKTLMKINLRLVAERLAGERDVGQGVADVAGARLRIGGLAGVAGESAETFEGLVEGDALARGDVDGEAGDFFGRGGGGEQVGVDDVGDEGEVAARLAVTIDSGLLACEHFAAEDGEDAGVVRRWVLIRAEDVEVAESDSFKAVDAREGAHVIFAGKLGDGIGADGVGRHAFVLGEGGRVAISRRRAGVDDAADSGGARGHEEIQRGVNAVAVGGNGIGDRARDGGEGCFVEDDFDAGACLSADG